MAKIADNVKVKARKSGATKVFQVLANTASAVIGITGGVVIAGTAVVSGIGYFAHDKIMDKITSLGNQISSQLNSEIDKVTEQITQTLEANFPQGTISADNVDQVMQIIENTFKSVIKVPLPNSVVDQIKDAMDETIKENGPIQIPDLSSQIETQIKNSEQQIASYITSMAANVNEFLYGQQTTDKNGNIDFSKLYIWNIVFITTTTVIGVLILAGILYGIAYAIDKSIKGSDVAQAKQILRSSNSTRN